MIRESVISQAVRARLYGTAVMPRDMTSDEILQADTRMRSIRAARILAPGRVMAAKSEYQKAVEDAEWNARVEQAATTSWAIGTAAAAAAGVGLVGAGIRGAMAARTVAPGVAHQLSYWSSTAGMTAERIAATARALTQTDAGLQAALLSGQSLGFKVVVFNGVRYGVPYERVREVVTWLLAMGAVNTARELEQAPVQTAQ